MMIGPSAPNGPPVPIAIAEASGFSSATRGCTLLPVTRIDSIASGMPWPRIFSEPKRAISPIARPPQTGASRISSGRVVAFAGRHQRGAEALVEDEVGDQADQPQQAQATAGAERADRHREGGDRQHPAGRREVAEMAHVGPIAAHLSKQIYRNAI